MAVPRIAGNDLQFLPENIQMQAEQLAATAGAEAPADLTIEDFAALPVTDVGAASRAAYADLLHLVGLESDPAVTHSGWGEQYL